MRGSAAESREVAHHEQRNFRAGVVASAWVLSLVAAVFPALGRAPDPDESWLIYLGREILQGKRLGIDYIEVTPPMGIWKTLPAIWLERSTGIPVWPATVLLYALLSVLAGALLVRLLKAGNPFGRWQTGLLAATALGCLLIPGTDFVSRETLTLAATIPYMVLVATRISWGGAPVATAVGIGALGGVGFLLKPYFLLPLLMVESRLWFAMGVRTLRRPELVSLVLTIIIQIVATLVFAPEYLGTTRQLAGLYATYLGNGTLVGLGMAGPFLLLLALNPLADWASRRAEDPMRDVFGLACLGFLIAAALQGKGFPYHYVPAWGFGVLAATHIWLAREGKLSLRPSVLIVRVSFVVVLAIATRRLVEALNRVTFPDRYVVAADPSYAPLLVAARRWSPARSVAVLSSNIGSGWPLVFTLGAHWPLRYPSLWMLPALHANQVKSGEMRLIHPRPVEGQSADERRFYRELIDDLMKGLPDLLVVLNPDSTVTDWGGARRFDYEAYLRSDRRYDAFKSGYEKVEDVGPYSIWRRRGL